jgi:hypothetical protein
MENHLNIQVKPTDYHYGDGQLKLTGITTENWISHFDFFVPQKVSDGDTDDCWDFACTKNVDAFMDALIQDGLIPASVVQELISMGFMDTGTDGAQHFHSSERFAGVLSGLKQNGGNLNAAYDIFRKYGCVPFTALPVTPGMTIEEYFAPIPQSVMDIGARFLALMGGKDFVQYQWINDGGATNVNQMAQVISKGPLSLGIPVNGGWNQVHPTIATGQAVHVVSAYSVPAPSVYVSDNYAPFLKILDPGYQMSYVMQVIVQYIPPTQSTPTASSLPAVPQTVQPTQANLNILQQIVSLYQKLVAVLKGRNLGSTTMSQTQLSNFATTAGVLALLLQHLGIIIPPDNIAFILFAVWSVGWSAYNYWQRYQKGDLTLGGIRKATS